MADILSQEEIDALLDVVDEEYIYDHPEELKELYRLVDMVEGVYYNNDLGKINFNLKKIKQETAIKLKRILLLEEEINKARQTHPDMFI